MSGDLVETVAGNLEVVRRRIDAAGGDRHAVQVVAVTKTFGEAAVRAALHAGLTDIGENYADELVGKAIALAAHPEPGVAAPRWHYLGAVQRRHLGPLAAVVTVYEGVDRLEEGEAIARRRPGASVLVEVDTTARTGRGGVAPGEVAALVTALAGLDLAVRGLMTVAPPGAGAEAATAFEIVGRLRAELGLAEASMGMTEDLELAVAAGSTMVRVGRGLFGPRVGSPPVPE